MTINIKKLLSIKLYLVLAGLVSLLALFGGSTAQAAPTDAATWKDKYTIVHNGIEYRGPEVIKINYGMDGNQATVQAFKSSSGNTILFFPEKANLDTETSVGYNDTPSAINAITVKLTNTRASAPNGTPPPGATTPGTPTADAETCNIAGVGWIVCPVATFLSKITDGAYSFFEQLLVFQVSPDPFSSDPAVNPTFAIWSSVRNIANIAFIVAFFMVIFSQATSIGLSNYGIKKMLPRIIVAAIMVNLSYYLCIFAIDVSNILGAGLDGIVKLAIAKLPQPDNATWEQVTAGVLMGTVGAVALGALAIAATGTVLAFLVTALLAIFTAIIVLAARQAFLVILIVLSPLAFVAYILPNTENLFDKWRKAFTTLLIMYPLVAILFAGAQVAASIIRSTAPAGPPGVIISIISLGVQAIPLFAVPFIVKFSGGVIGRVAGIVNNPNKGLIDRARKFGDETAGVRGRKLRQQERATRKSKDFYRAMSGESKGLRSRMRRSVGQAGVTGLGSQYITPGGREDISSTRQGLADQYRKIQTEETGRALASVIESGGFSQGTKYSLINKDGTYVKDASGADIKDTTNHRTMVEYALQTPGSRVVVDNGVKTSEFDSKEISGALMSQTAKMGDIPLTQTLLNKGGDTAAGMREFISYNTGNYAAKAPDFIKGAPAAFGKPTTEEMMAWHPSTAQRASSFATSNPGAAHEIAITIAQALNNPELRGKLRRENLITFQSNPTILSSLSSADQASLATLITTGK